MFGQTFFFFQVMTKYISNPDNLKLMMNMLKEKSRNIQFEAFHVFKVRFDEINRRTRLSKLKTKKERSIWPNDWTTKVRKLF